MMRIQIIYFLFFLMNVVKLFACTSFIVPGNLTSNGRPVLYKHRDTSTEQNAVVKFNDGKYLYCGIVNVNEKMFNEVWSGYNSAGFAIMNTAAYNNNIGDTTTLADREGVVMKLALMFCANLKDFENLLDTLPKPLGVDANFGVIDAYGGAAYYETGNFGYTKFDAAGNGNNKKVTIRTNYSKSGTEGKGFGYIRCETASAFFNPSRRDFTPLALVNGISRNMNHSLTDKRLDKTLAKDSSKNDFRFFTDYIPRSTTASVTMIVGVNSTENCKDMVMWTILGHPFASFMFPVWLEKELQLPKCIQPENDSNAPLCQMATQLKKRFLPIVKGSGSNYIDFAKVKNRNKNGSLQIIYPYEYDLFQKTKDLKETKDKAAFYKKFDSNVYEFYNNKFGITPLRTKPINTQKSVSCQ